MEEALADIRHTVEYVEAFNSVVNAEANEMLDTELESLMEYCGNEFDDDVDTGACHVGASDI